MGLARVYHVGGSVASCINKAGEGKRERERERKKERERERESDKGGGKDETERERKRQIRRLIAANTSTIKASRFTHNLLFIEREPLYGEGSAELRLPKAYI